ncbi:MAG: hypothetical protein ABGY24_13965 [bacterium]
MINEAKVLVASGAKELNLVAEDTNQYYLDRPRDGRNLALLLRELGKIEGLHWIRILYAYPVRLFTCPVRWIPSLSLGPAPVPSLASRIFRRI